MRLVCRAAGRAVPDTIETIWKNPEFRTDGETTDAAIKRVQAGLADIRQGREDVGYSATQIQQMEQRDQAVNPLETAEELAEANLEMQRIQIDQARSGGDRNSAMTGQHQSLMKPPIDGDKDGLVNEPR